jgi:hypothetical protein
MCVNESVRKGSRTRLVNLREEYDQAFASLDVFLETGRTYEGMSVEEFKEEVSKFWKRCDIWKAALENSVYSEEKLNADFDKVRLQMKRLLF